MALGSKKAQYAPPGWRPPQPQQPYRSPQPQGQPGQVPPRPVPQAGAFNQPAQPPTVSIEPKTLLLIGGVALFIVATFAIILVIRANQPHCPPDIQQGLCDLSVTCSEATNFEVVRVPTPGCDLQLEISRASCQGKSEDGVLSKFFDPKYEVCVTDEDSTQKVAIFSPTERVTGIGGTYRITTRLDQPFNLKNDEVLVDILMEDQQGTDFKITHVELDGNDAQFQLAILGETLPNRPIPAPQVHVPIRLQLDVVGNEPTGSFNDLSLIIDTSFNQRQGDVVTPGTDKLIIPLRNLAFSWLRPSRKYDCPEADKCNDNDASTRDYCDPSNAPFCKHDPVSGVCGNGVCDANENKCTCAQDCGQCAATGQVTTLQCIQNQCAVQLQPTVKIEAIKTVTQEILGAVSVTTTIEYNQPFNAKNDVMTITIKLDTRSADVQAFTIDTVQMFKGAGNQIASATINQELAVQGSSASATLRIPATSAEELITPDLKISYTLRSGDVENKGSYPGSVQQITTYNPG